MKLNLAGAVAGQDELDHSGRYGVCCGDEDVTQPPSVSGQRVHDEDEMKVVTRSNWQQHAPAGEQEQAVTQLAAYSTADGKRSNAVHEDFCEEGASAVAQTLSQSWQHPDDGRPSDFDGRIKTRSSAIAEGPRDASCQLKSCQLPCNSAETTYTISPDQIDGMKLEI